MVAINAAALSRFVGGLLKAPPPANETEVEYRVLGPVMERLGWDVHTQIEWRRRVGASTKPGVVDISLHAGDGTPKVLLEAKKWDASLDRYVEQLMRYAFQEAAPVVVLTNGREWRFYLPREVGDVRDRVFAEVDFTRDRRSAVNTLIEFLGVERVLSGEAERAAREALVSFRKQREAADALPEVWSDMRAGPDSSLVRLVSKRVKEATGTSPRLEDVVEVVRAAHPQVEAPK